jgi:YD repeat-containing protein
MKNILSFLLLSVTTFSFSQIVENDFTPSVLPPAPTVASLMKFEEIPVSYYTGIPDVSIPVFSTKLKNGQDLKVRIDYHPANVNANEIASDCGLGWSLIAGGSISRTVKGFPDELLKLDGSSQSGKVGVYQTSTSNHINRYYEYADIIENNGINSSNIGMINEYLWDVNVRNKYDTEHDLYQYNFMGYTGRFFVKKDNGNLVVVKLDKNPLQIINNYNSSTYVHDSFTIIDEFGNRYVFNVKETSTYTNATSTINYNYISAFHLAEIRDSNDILLAGFTYSNASSKEGRNLSTSTYNYDVNNVINNYNMIYGSETSYNNYHPLPTNSLNMVMVTTATRKLDFISVEGTCKIYFDFTQGRSDDDLLLRNNAYKLDEIEIKTWKDEPYRKYHFSHSYTSNYLYSMTNEKKRMTLSQVDMYDKNDEFISRYVLEYKQNQSFVPIGKDYWGYFNLAACDHDSLEPSAGFSDLDVLQKIQYPEGGCAIFDYESNTYSSEGDVAITDFDANPANWYVDSHDDLVFVAEPHVNNVPQPLNYSATDVQYVDIYPGFSQVTGEEYRFLSLYKNNTMVRGFSCIEECLNCKIRVVLDAGAHYDLRFSNMDLNRQDEVLNVGVDYVKKTVPANQYLLGGGNRIKKIGYFDEDMDARYYQDYPSYNSSGAPEKEVNYTYSFFNNLLQSSGALAYPKPKYTYNKFKKECPYLGTNSNAGNEFDIEYQVITRTDNLAAIKTKGADVGYKNVTVFETGNGYKQMIYTNATDYPETLTYENLNPPFLPTLNIDYKRGLLLEEFVYDELNPSPLRHTTNSYSFVEDIIKTGINVYTPNGYDFNNARNATFYSQYEYFINNHTTSCFCCFDTPMMFTDDVFHEELLGWAKLDSSITVENFYDASNTLIDDITTTKTFTYNPVNYKLASEQVTDAYGQTLDTNYFYPCDASMSSKPQCATLVTRNIIGLPLVTQKLRGTTELFEKETEYGSFTSQNLSYPLILPKYIYTKKDNFSNTAFKEITFDYDVEGNLVQFTKENGVPTSFVWGYDKTYPVAKIENCSYASINSGLLSAIETNTNSQSATQSQVISSLNALRSALTGSMVTTYTYNSVVGITSITDPKGYTTFFDYDGFGRLNEQKDAQGNVISENEYHYRTQN